jgi:hypothetical protein
MSSSSGKAGSYRWAIVGTPRDYGTADDHAGNT